MRVRRAAAIAALGLVAATALGWWRVDGPGAPEPARDARHPAPFDEMDFALTDHEARSVGPETLKGRAALIFFGFTNCPDICPTTLAEIAVWLEALGPDGEAFLPIFITVDPERDDVEALAGYVGAFHSAIRGWTGSPAEIARAAAGFRVVYRKVPFEDDYAMDHTAGIFLYSRKGRFVTLIDPHESRDMALPKLRRALAEGSDGAGG